MKKQLRSKLSLDRESLRVLAQNDLDSIAGGRFDPSHVFIICESSDCPTAETCFSVSCEPR
jgi:hypothetical protein